MRHFAFRVNKQIRRISAKGEGEGREEKRRASSWETGRRECSSSPSTGDRSRMSSRIGLPVVFNSSRVSTNDTIDGFKAKRTRTEVEEFLSESERSFDKVFEKNGRGKGSQAGREMSAMTREERRGSSVGTFVEQVLRR